VESAQVLAGLAGVDGPVDAGTVPWNETANMSMEELLRGIGYNEQGRLEAPGFVVCLGMAVGILPVRWSLYLTTHFSITVCRKSSFWVIGVISIWITAARYLAQSWEYSRTSAFIYALNKLFIRVVDCRKELTKARASDC
jgi:hypothetical protein